MPPPINPVAISYALVYLFAFASGVGRVLRDKRVISVRDVLAIGLCSGFLGFSIVVLLVPDELQRGPTGLAVASLCGLAGKEITQALTIQTLKHVIGRVVENLDKTPADDGRED